MSAKNKTEAKPNALNKTEVVTLRLDPKRKFILELLSRKQYRTISSVIEWMIDSTAMGKVSSEDGFEDINQIWDVNEADRLVKLALIYPNLLNYEEQIIWKIISENGHFWRGNYKKEYWIWDCGLESAVFERIREFFPLILKIASGEEQTSKLPTFHKTKEQNEEGEIPF